MPRELYPSVKWKQLWIRCEWGSWHWSQQRSFRLVRAQEDSLKYNARMIMIYESTMNISINSRVLLLRGSITQDFILLVIPLVDGCGDCVDIGSEAAIPFCKSFSKAARNDPSSFSVISSITKVAELRVLSSIVSTEPSRTKLFIFEFERICGVKKCCRFSISTEQGFKRVESEWGTVAIVELTWIGSRLSVGIVTFVSAMIFSLGPGSMRLSTI